MRILQRREDLSEFAYFSVAVLHTIVCHLPQDVTCDIIESKIHSSLKCDIDYKTEYDLSDQSKITSDLDLYILKFLQASLKAPNEDPIIIAKDSVVSML